MVAAPVTLRRSLAVAVILGACVQGAVAGAVAPSVAAGAPGSRAVDRVAGLALPVPSGWTASFRPLTRIVSPVERVALSSYPLVGEHRDPGCFPRRAIEQLPADGALALLVEYVGLRPRLLSRYPRRPARWQLAERAQQRRLDGCSAGSHQRLRFRDGGRAFDLTIWLGSAAAERTRRDLEQAIRGLEVAAQTVGRSRAGRPIRAVELGDPAASGRVLVVGCIHGDECAASAVLRRLRRGPLRAAIDLWIVPTLNPDGRARGIRQNARGVDLNRNFPGTWRRLGERGHRYWSGPRPASEPETRVAMRLIERLRPTVTIWFHQPETNVRSGGASERLARRYARLVGLPYRPLPVPPGAATAWQTARFPGSQAFAVELPPGPLSARAAARHARAVWALLDR